MGESSTHGHLVRKIINYINRQEPNSIVLCDSYIEESYSSNTQNINGYIPDVLALNAKLERVYIGEAKTSKDLERRHSESQIKSFLAHCSQNEITFIIAVPWDVKRLAASLIKRWIIEIGLANAKTIIIDCTYE